MSLRIEELREEYIDGLYEVELDCFKLPWDKQSFIDELSNPLAVYYVLILDNKIIGYAGMWHILDEGHITNIGVLSAYRKKGYASLLLERLITYMSENKLNFLTLEVRASNYPAQALYEKFGFYKIGLRKNYYADREDAILYKLERKKDEC